MRMVLEQVISLQVKLDIDGLEEDYLELFEPGYLAQVETKVSYIKWDGEEEDDIQQKTKRVLERTAEWVERKKATKLGAKSNSARNSEVTLHSPKCFSNNTSMPIRAGKDKKPPHVRHKSNPALDFSTP